MLSHIDNIIFSDRCDVLEIAAQRYVYPVFKNGSSSLYKTGYKLVDQCKLSGLQEIEVYVRSPLDRFVSGVQTFLMHNQHLDRETALVFIEQYLFLNKHFCPQFYWLVNLQRFSNARLKLLPLKDLESITGLRENVSQRESDLAKRFLSNPKVNYYLQLDKVLVDNIGNTITFDNLLEQIKINTPDLYIETVGKAKQLCNVLG